MKGYANLAFEAVNAMKLWRGAAAASTHKVKIVIRSIRFLSIAQKITKPSISVCDNFTYFLRSSMILVNQEELSYEKYIIP